MMKIWMSTFVFVLLLGTACAQQSHKTNGKQKDITPKALEVGSIAPSFTALDQDSNWVILDSLRKSGDVVLIFYRGYWCPHCNSHLKKLQDSLELIQAKGAHIIAITPESSEGIEKSSNKSGAQFKILFDEGNKIMTNYNVKFQMRGAKLTLYKAGGINLEKINGNANNDLPVPATYIIGRDGKIKFAHFDEDYRVRASVKTIIENL